MPFYVNAMKATLKGYILNLPVCLFLTDTPIKSSCISVLSD